MGYDYDLFVSVKRDDIFGDWVRTSFLPLFSAYLRNDVIERCQRQFAGMFFYEKTLLPGDQWPDELQNAIRGSRVGLALCSPEYFFSEWCLTEFHSFRKRGGKVLVPVSIHDGKGFPQEAKALQMSDLSEYVIVGKGFKETERYVQFQDKLKELSKDVAERILGAPTYSEWPVDKTAPGAVPEIPQKTLES